MKIQYVCDYCGKISFSCSEIEECEEKHLEEKLIQEEKDDRLKEIRKAIEAFESDYQEKFHCCGDECSCGAGEPAEPENPAPNTKKGPVKASFGEKDIEYLLKCVFGIN